MFDSYARLSWNPSTRELEKIETQHGDNDATIARHGGMVGQYLDDGLSAWKAGVRRKDFETLLERARAGVTQGIAVWHVDRLFRQPRDLERLIDLADHGFRVISSHGSRDLSDADDRFILRIEVAHAAGPRRTRRVGSGVVSSGTGRKAARSAVRRGSVSRVGSAQRPVSVVLSLAYTCACRLGAAGAARPPVPVPVPVPPTGSMACSVVDFVAASVATVASPTSSGVVASRWR